MSIDLLNCVLSRNAFERVVIFLVFVSASLCLVEELRAQTPMTDRDLKSDAAKISTEDSDENRYLIGIGDVLDVRIFGRPELSRDAVRVDERGMIRVPLVEMDIRASCRTETELSREIANRYVEYLRNPHVDVFIKDFRSKFVAVLGAVREPGRFQLQRRIRLLELLSFAGGPTDKAGGRIQIKHAPEIEQCEVKDKTALETPVSALSANDVSSDWYELESLMQGGESPSANPYIRPGDIVNMIEADKIYVIGNVYRPSIIPLKEKITLTEAIATAGGTLPDTDFDHVRIVRKTKGQTAASQIVVDLKSIKKQQSEDIVLQSDDIVEVPTSSGKKFIHGLLNSVAPSITRLPVTVIPRVIP